MSSRLKILTRELRNNANSYLNGKVSAKMQKTNLNKQLLNLKMLSLPEPRRFLN